jgi:ankyrin repeat protein
LFQVLLEAGADPFHVNYSGVNPLMCAARCGSGPCIEALLEEGVDADYANTDLGGGEHALLLAAESGSVAAVRLLLAAGARLNRADKEGRTPLWAAARYDRWTGHEQAQLHWPFG